MNKNAYLGLALVCMVFMSVPAFSEESSDPELQADLTTSAGSNTEQEDTAMIHKKPANHLQGTGEKHAKSGEKKCKNVKRCHLKKHHKDKANLPRSSH